ncbi:MAG: LPD38 domain-containing protein [bacterium]|nr:LPD38 domain-containing protein [bacterium]
MSSDPLDFLDDPLDFLDDPLDFLDEDQLDVLDEPPEPSLLQRVVDDVKDKFTPKPSASQEPIEGATASERMLSAQNRILDVYKPEDKTPDQLKEMSVSDRREYAKQINTYTDLRKSLGFIKGVASEATLGASEYIPGMQRTEDDLTTLGSILGQTLPVTVGAKYIVAPIVKLALKAPKYAQGLASLARIGGWAAVGVTKVGAEKIISGEMPTAKELTKEALLWGGIETAIEATGRGIEFTKAIRSIAEKEGVSTKDVLKQLWKAIKNRFGPAIKPTEILPAEAEALVDEAVGRAGEEVDITPKPVPVTKEITGAERKAITKQEPVAKVVTPEATVAKIVQTEAVTPHKEGKKQLQTDILKIQDQIAATLQSTREYGKLPTTDETLKQLNEQLQIKKQQLLIAQKGPVIKVVTPEEKPTKIEQPFPEDKKGELKSREEREVIESPSLEAAKGSLPKKTIPQSPEAKQRQPVIGKEQAVAKSKIINLFRKAFRDPIRIGKISQRKAAGIHKMWPKVTRLLRDNDVETAAHEIGHNLHTTLYGGDAKTPQEQRENVVKALSAFLNELKPIARYEPYTLEGFAEFTRMYVTNPAAAQKLAPKFYVKFEADLEAQYPELRNALLEARDYYDKYLHGTPQSRIRAQTSYGDDPKTFMDLIDGVKAGVEKLKWNLLDNLYPAKQLVAAAFGVRPVDVENIKDAKNLYRAARLLKGAIGKADVFISHETFDPIDLNKNGESFVHILEQLPTEEDLRTFNDYLIARRAIEKHGQGIQTGINLGDAIYVVKQYEKRFKDLEKEWHKYADNLMSYAQESGLISLQQQKLIKQNNMYYAPFYRAGKGKAGGVSKRLQAAVPFKRMKGSSADIISPIESMLKLTYNVIINSEKNRVGQVLGSLATMKDVGTYVERVPTPMKLKSKIAGEEVENQIAKNLLEMGFADLVEWREVKGKAFLGLREDLVDAIPELFLKFGPGKYPAGENIVTVFYDGKPVYYEVSPDLYKMWSKGIEPYTAGLITKILRIPARTLRAGAILNPKFWAKNIVRDTWGGFLFSKYGSSLKDPVGVFLDTLYAPIGMTMQAARKSPLYVEWLKAGGGMSTMQSLDRTSVTKKLDRLRNSNYWKHPIQMMRLLGEITEEANRLAEFARALKVERQTRLGKEIAAFASRDISIDFAKIGLSVQALNQIIPFFNATVQGGDKLVRTIGNKEDRKKFIPKFLSLIVMPSLLLAIANKDDERIEELYEEEKDFNFVVGLGDKIIKIPVPFETGVIGHGLTRRMFRYAMQQDADVFEGFMGSVMSAMLPNFIPTLQEPFFEVAANKNFFTNAPIVPEYKKGLISKYQYKTGTSSTARLLGRAAAYMLGQETRSKLASPAIIDHFINSWTGGLGRMMVDISDRSLEAAGLVDKIPGPQRTITEQLGLDAFTTRYPKANSRSIEKFYENYADAIAQEKSLSLAKKEELESPEEIDRGYQRMERIYDLRTLKAAYKAMQMCRREINSIWSDPNIDQDTKQKLVDELYLQQIDFARRANEDIKIYRLSR